MLRVSVAAHKNRAAFDADVVGESDRIRATFEALAQNATQAAAGRRRRLHGHLRVAIGTRFNDSG